MAAIVKRAVNIISQIENKLINAFYRRFPPENFLPAVACTPSIGHYNVEQVSLTDLLKKTIVWAVPVRRRSIERRRCRRFGHPDYFYKLLLPKKNILVCNKCGSYREAGLLCPVCYEKVITETKSMQKNIQKSLGYGPIENEVVVLYQGEDSSNEFYKGKRIVEMPKPRPQIFSNNLLQKTTQGNSTSKEVIEKNELLVS